MGEQDAAPARPSLAEVTLLFLRLGFTAFGGPAVHVAIMRQEVVERRGWLTEAQFLDLLGAANLLPGPSSTELAIYIGFRQAGVPGLLLAGICFILPAFLMVLALVWAYVRFGHLPALVGILGGVKPVVIAIVAQAVWVLAKTALKTWTLIAVFIGAAVAVAVGVSPLLVLVSVGAAMALVRPGGERGGPSVRPLFALLAAIAVLALLPAAFALIHPIGDAPGVGAILLAFVKLGSVVYGSGYVLIAFLRADLVAHHRWLTSTQLLDAVAVGQVTPGPVFTTATFIGYVLAGTPGAVAATVGIFLPAFLLVGLSGSLIPRLRQSPSASAFMDGVNAGSLALMAVVTWELGRSTLTGPMPIALASMSALLLLRWRVNSMWLVLGGAVVGLVAGAAR